MYNLINLIYKIKDIISQYRDLNVVSLKRTLFLILIIIFVMIFDALSIMSIMPLIQFIQAEQNIDNFIGSTDYGIHLVNIFNYLYIPFNILSLSIILLMFVAIRQFMNIFEVLETQRTTLKIAKDLSIDTFNKIMCSKASYIRGLKQGQFTVLCENECVRTSNLYKTFLQLISASFQIGAYALVMFYTAPKMTSIALLAILLLLLSMYKFVSKSHITGEMLVSIRKNFYNFISENFSLWRLFKFGDSIKNELEKIELLANTYAEKQLDLIKYTTISRLIIAIVAMFLCVLFLNLSVNYFSFDFGKITLFCLIFIRLIPLGQKLNSLTNSIVAFIPSLFTLKNILREAESNKEQFQKGKIFESFKSSIEFKNISFSYNALSHNLVLDNINLKIPANKITAIIGRSGSGKSTLIDLLPRIISPKSGSIFIDGENIKDFSLSSIRNQISYVSQEAILFDGTIKKNISYYNEDISDQEIKNASILAGADEFIKNLPGNYNYIIGERGQNLSGGQKQRLILARAFLSKSKILILDEATSALDHTSELYIKKAIKTFIKNNNSTIIIIAHRHTTIENADYVVYLDNGKVQDVGDPQYIFNKFYSI